MFFLLQRLDPAWKAPNFDAWAAAISLMRRRDGRTDDEIRRVFAWANADPFWRRNILSPEKLRRQYQRLMLEMKNPNGRPRQRPIGPGQWYDPEAAKKDPDHGKM
jgi:hypothetical protein